MSFSGSGRPQTAFKHSVPQPSGNHVTPEFLIRDFFDRPEISDFGGLGGPGWPGNLPKSLEHGSGDTQLTPGTATTTTTF